MLFKLLRSFEDIEASFTHMTMEEVWVAFHEVVVQCSLTVEIDTIHSEGTLVSSFHSL